MTEGDHLNIREKGAGQKQSLVVNEFNVPASEKKSIVDTNRQFFRERDKTQTM